jgi:hypothetical protein
VEVKIKEALSKGNREAAKYLVSKKLVMSKRADDC